MRTTFNSLSGISGQMNSRAGECFDISHTLADANRNQGESIEKLIEEITNGAQEKILRSV